MMEKVKGGQGGFHKIVLSSVMKDLFLLSQKVESVHTYIKHLRAKVMGADHQVRDRSESHLSIRL